MTKTGAVELRRLGVQVQLIRTGTVHKVCADYTQRLPGGSRRVPHIGGALGAVLTAWLMNYGLEKRLREPETFTRSERKVHTSEGLARLVSIQLIDRATLEAVA